MYKVYINERLLQFLPPNESTSGADIVFKLTGRENKKELQEFIAIFEKNDLVSNLFLVSEDIDTTWKTFMSNYLVLEAAGGIVINQFSELLMIFRNGKWDLPKGKIEENEESDIAAVREVYEECGIEGLILRKQLHTTYHTYPFKDKKILKKTFWFQMTTSDLKKPIPQLEEGITMAKWLNKSQVQEALKNSYLSISSLLKEKVIDDHERLLE